MPVAVVARIAVIDRRVDAPMEVTPVVMEMRPVIGVPISVAVTAAMKDRRRAKATTAERRRGAKAAAMDRYATASEPAATERGTAAPEATAMKPAAPKTTAVKSATAAAEAAASTAPETTTAAAATAKADVRRQPVGCKFRGRRRAGTRKRERFGALL